MKSVLNPKRLLIAGAVAGSMLAGIAVGVATTLGTTAASAASSSPSPPAAGAPAGAPGNMPAPGTPAHENAETPVTGANAAKAQAAAVKAVGGGTAGAVTTDYFKTGYEVTVTKSDGTKVEVHLDSSFNVMQPPPH